MLLQCSYLATFLLLQLQFVLWVGEHITLGSMNAYCNMICDGVARNHRALTVKLDCGNKLYYFRLLRKCQAKHPSERTAAIEVL